MTPCSLRFLIMADMRLSWGSLRKSSAHSTISAFSFSHTFGWPLRSKKTKRQAFAAGLNNWLMQYFYKQKETHTLFSTLLTSLANSLEQTSKWNIFPQFDTHAPSSYRSIRRKYSFDFQQLIIGFWWLHTRDWSLICPHPLESIWLTVNACMATCGSLWFTLLIIDRRHSLGLQNTSNSI